MRLMRLIDYITALGIHISIDHLYYLDGVVANLLLHHLVQVEVVIINRRVDVVQHLETGSVYCRDLLQRTQVVLELDQVLHKVQNL